LKNYMSIIKSVIFAVVVATFSIVACHAELSEMKRAFEIADTFKVSTLTSPTLSSSGKWLAYSTVTPNYDKNGQESAVYLTSTSGGEPRLLLDKGTATYAPKWVPATDQLGFVAIGENGRPQVFSHDPSNGESVQITNVAQGVSGYSWGPGGKKLALIIKDEKKTDEHWEGVKPPWVIDRQQFKADGVGYLDNTHSHIYVYDIDSKQLKQVTHGNYDHAGVSFSPDGKQLVFQSNRTRNPDGNGDIDIWTVPVDGDEHPLTKISTSDDTDWSPVWSPDGRYILYRTYSNPDIFYFSLRKTALYDTHTKETRVVTDYLDRSEHGVSFSPDGKEILFLLENEGKYNLASLPVAGGKHKLITREEDHWIFGYSVANDGKTVVLKGSPETPGSYYSSGNIFLLKENGYEQLTHHNEQHFADVELSKPEMFWYTSTDGKKIQAWLYKPYGFDPEETYPLVIDIHGGPIMQFGYRWEPIAQTLAANGYFVLLPNIRGSSGYGGEFQLGIDIFDSDQDLDDIIAGAEYVAERPYIDRNRMAIQGWSSGGGATNRIITRHPDVFAAAIAGAGRSSNQYADYGVNIYQAATEKLSGLPWENREAWVKTAPFDLAGNVKTPTMFVSGERDWNVSVTNSERMYQALKRRGLDTLLVVYPGQAHGISAPKYEEHRQEMYLKWYEKHLE
jgi:dipeptidyl aminopeptidase/acylaminoacyl peptidase